MNLNETKQERKSDKQWVFSYERQRNIREAIYKLVGSGKLTGEVAYIVETVLRVHTVHMTGNCSPSYAQIASGLGFSVSKIERAFTSAQATGLIDRRRRGYSKYFDITWAEVDENGCFEAISNPSDLRGSNTKEKYGRDSTEEMGSGCGPLGHGGADADASSPWSRSSFQSDRDDLATVSRESGVAGDMDREENDNLSHFPIDPQNDHETDSGTAGDTSLPAEPAAGVEVENRARDVGAALFRAVRDGDDTEIRKIDSFVLTPAMEARWPRYQEGLAASRWWRREITWTEFLMEMEKKHA